MSRRLLALGGLALTSWLLSGFALRAGAPTTADLGKFDAATVMMIGCHLGAAAWLRLTRRRPSPGRDPEWADVQAERLCRQGAGFAIWGASAALAWFLVRPWFDPGRAIRWPVVLVVAGNVGFQPWVLGALGLVVAARIRLGRRFAAPAEAGPVRVPMS